MEECRNGGEGQPCADYAVGAHDLEQISSTTEARSVREQVDDEHGEESGFEFHHAPEGRANDPRRTFLQKCGEVLLQLNQGEKSHFGGPTSVDLLNAGL